MDYRPLYQDLLERGGFPDRVKKALVHLEACDVCPRVCGINRAEGELGECQTGRYARVSSSGPHMGEEEPLRGWNGSGTIFFNRCNLKCQYCQNYDISQQSGGQEITGPGLAEIMLHLQEQGCHNINFVSPSHLVPQIIEAVYYAAQKGLTVPLVYNTGGYDALDSLRLLEGIIDIYMPDIKYGDSLAGERYSGVPDYAVVNQAAVKEMYRQVGDLQIDSRGIARRGLLVRHLVLPNGRAGTARVVRFIADNISKNTYLNLMDQYRPAHRAHQFPELNRRISVEEYQRAVKRARDAGLTRLDERKSFFWRI